MSFSGYFQLLCERGHYREVDCFSLMVGEEASWCVHCSASIVWDHLVDTTNDDGSDQRVELEEIAPEVVDVCDECGHETIVESARYKIPRE